MSKKEWTKKFTSDFKLVGLTRRTDNNGCVATCEPLDKEETFKAEIKMSVPQQESLWDLCEGDWSNKKIAVVEHEGLYESGIPINPTLITIRYAI